MYTYQGMVTNVVDGDTVDIVIDLGFKITYTIRARLHGINAPEMNTPEGKAARAWLLNAVGGPAEFVRPWLWVKTIKDKKDKYGRYLVILAPNATGEQTEVLTINERMIHVGHATRYEGR